MSRNIYKGDLPKHFPEKLASVAIDVESTGLDIFYRDRVCLIQLCTDQNEVFLIQADDKIKPHNLIRLLQDKTCLKIFHYARFDVAALYKYTNIMTENIYCTKIASILARTYSNRHSLKALCHELLGQNISKAEGSSYWGGPELSESQISYACNDVLFLHEIMNKLNRIIVQEKRRELLNEIFYALKARIMLDIAGFEDIDIFHHNPFKH